MKRILLISAAFLFCFLLSPPVSHAQGTVTCESNHNRQTYCRINDPRARVDFVRQLGSAPCVEGRTWGNDGQGIWVDAGCRATFRITPYGGGGPSWWYSPPGRPPAGINSGACFFTNYNFAGRYFCQQRGQSASLSGTFNNSISSIQIFGRARVTLFSKANFSGHRATIDRSVPDMRRLIIPSTGGKWNDRVSAIRVD